VYSPGATISVTAAGGDFPAFSGTVTGPGTLAGYTVPTTISRAGYTATWTAGSGPKIWVFVIGLASTTTTDIICRGDDTGTFTIPPSTFALLPAAADQGVAAVARVAELDLTTPLASVYVVDEISSGLIPITQ